MFKSQEPQETMSSPKSDPVAKCCYNTLVNLSLSLSACLPARPPARPPACLPACLPACFSLSLSLQALPCFAPPTPPRLPSSHRSKPPAAAVREPCRPKVAQLEAPPRSVSKPRARVARRARAERK